MNVLAFFKALFARFYTSIRDDFNTIFIRSWGLILQILRIIKTKGRIHEMETALRIRFSMTRLYLITKIGVLEWKIIRRAMLGLNNRAKTFRL